MMKVVTGHVTHVCSSSACPKISNSGYGALLVFVIASVAGCLMVQLLRTRPEPKFGCENVKV